MFKSCKPVHKTVNVWTEDSIETLKGCFLCTDWSIFHSLELDEAADTITDYMKICTDNVVAQKEVVIHPNNKPYITKEIKECINRKKQAFRNKDRASLIEVQKELKQLLTKAREQHRKTMEHSLLTSNTKKETLGYNEISN